MTTTDPSTAIRRALSRTTLPPLEADLLTAAVVTGIDVHGSEATIEVDPDAAGVESETLMTTVMETVQDVPGIDHVDVKRRPPGPDVASNVEDFDRVIAVASAKGGVGKSTVASHLAAALAAEGGVALFDADVHGPNVPKLFDVEGPVYSTDDGRPVPIWHEGLEVMSVGLLESDVPLAWRGAMAHDAVSQLFGETAWRGEDTLVIDLPPGTGDVVLTTLQEVPVDGILVVTTPFHTSVTDSNRTIELFRDEGVPVVGAVVNMAEFTCECCGEPNHLFEEGIEDLRTPVLAELPFDRTLQGQPVPGETPAAFADLAAAVESEIDGLGSYTVPPDALDIRGLAPEQRRQRVRDAFGSLSPGEEFRLVSDRDPTPVGAFLATEAGVDRDALEPFVVERKTPDAWVLTTTHP